jgi:hypothetical protein
MAGAVLDTGALIAVVEATVACKPSSTKPMPPAHY